MNNQEKDKTAKLGVVFLWVDGQDSKTE
jgi:hypothetical protein